MQKKVWLSPRALRLHAVILIIVPAFLALCVWQIFRAIDGNSLSWAYVFEWPLFAGYAIYMWWRILHEDATEETPPAAATNGAGGRADAAGPASVAPQPQEEQEDADLAAYNAYLAQLAEQDEAAGR
ncbi:MAG TPA: hypothetical protein VHD39_04090 [Acidimicrobiales bacterium]|nr:hypothetical protein [Acidimicrobiales bacterium]